MTSFSKEQLLQILSSTQKYKEVEPYLNGVKSENKEIFTIISQVMLEIMRSHTISPITKLQTLRLFKDVFMTSQFNCIESLDQDIQQHIFTVAAYNISSKKPDKGSNYFIEIQKRPNTKQNKQLSICYVTFAMELVKNTALLFPKDFQNEQSRYSVTYQSLLKNGLAFPKKNQYFFANDNQKFKKNLQAWLIKENEKMKKRSKNGKVQQVKQAQGNVKQIQKQAQNVESQNNKLIVAQKSHLQNAQSIANKQNVKPQPEIIESKNLQPKQTIQNGNNYSHKLKQQNTTKSKLPPNPMKKIQTIQQKSLQKAAAEKLQTSYELLVNEMETIKAQSMIYKQQNEKNALQREQMKKKLQIKTNELTQTKKILTSLQSKFLQNEKRLKQQQSVIKQQAQTIKTLSSNIKENNQPINQSSKQIEKIEKEQFKENYEKRCNFYQLQLRELKTQNQKLKDQINVLKKCSQQSKNAVKDHQIDMVLQQDSYKPTNNQSQFRKSGFIVDRNPQKKRKSSKFNQLMSNEYSMSNFLVEARKKQQEYQCKMQTQPTQNNNFYRTNSKSLSKTESSWNKFAMANKGCFDTTAFSNSNTKNNFFGNATISKQGKPIPRKASPQQRFHQDSQAKQLISIIPFIEDYFAPLKYEDSVEFKVMCLSKNSNNSIFNNQLIEVRIVHISSKKMVMTIRNKSSEEFVVDLKSRHDNFVIQNNQKKALQSCAYIDFTIKATPIDLNLRFPIFELAINNIYEKVYYSIPIPITLLNYCCFTQTDKFYKNQYTKIYKTQKFALNQRYRKISNCFPDLQFYSNSHRTIWVGEVKHKFLRDSDFLIKMVEQSRVVQIEVECKQETIGDKFSKVILQILLFLLM